MAAAGVIAPPVPHASHVSLSSLYSHVQVDRQVEDAARKVQGYEDEVAQASMGALPRPGDAIELPLNLAIPVGCLAPAGPGPISYPRR